MPDRKKVCMMHWPKLVEFETLKVANFTPATRQSLLHNHVGERFPTMKWSTPVTSRLPSSKRYISTVFNYYSFFTFPSTYWQMQLLLASFGTQTWALTWHARFWNGLGLHFPRSEVLRVGRAFVHRLLLHYIVFYRRDTARVGTGLRWDLRHVRAAMFRRARCIERFKAIVGRNWRLRRCALIQIQYFRYGAHFWKKFTYFYASIFFFYDFDQK